MSSIMLATMVIAASLLSTTESRSLDDAASRDVPDFGLMFNSDGDLSFTGANPEENVRNIRLLVDSLAGTPVKTLTYSVGAGSEILYYPTEVADTWGWRETPYDDKPQWAARIAKARAAAAAGLDAVRIAGERANALGLNFVPSYRMNDDHFMFDPFEYPLTGRFWLEHHETMTIGESPIRSDAHYGNLLDFSHQEVRAYRLAVIFEVIERYGDLMAGVELDFNRVQVFFPAGEAGERAHLITDMVRQVRRTLDKAGQRHGRAFSLFVRVPPTLRNCEWAGLEVATWIRERLVDVVIPAQLMTLSHDMPIGEFVAIAEPAGCQVYPALYPRSSYTWPLGAEPGESTYATPSSRRASRALIRGAISNYRQMGVAGFQLFNFGFPQSDWAHGAFRDAAHPAALHLADRVYAVTPAYYLDHEDSYQYRKQIPAELPTGEGRSLKLYVGENLRSPDGNVPPAYCGLRLGLRRTGADSALQVSLNGHVLHAGPVAKKAVTVSAPPSSWGAHPPPPAVYVQFPVEDLGNVVQGWNTVEVELSSTGKAAELVELQLGVLYPTDIFKW